MSKRYAIRIKICYDNLRTTSLKYLNYKYLLDVISSLLDTLYLHNLYRFNSEGQSSCQRTIGTYALFVTSYIICLLPSERSLKFCYDAMRTSLLSKYIIYRNQTLNRDLLAKRYTINKDTFYMHNYVVYLVHSVPGPESSFVKTLTYIYILLY